MDPHPTFEDELGLSLIGRGYYAMTLEVKLSCAVIHPSLSLSGRGRRSAAGEGPNS